MLAVMGGHEECSRVLLAGGSDVNIPNKVGIWAVVNHTVGEWLRIFFGSFIDGLLGFNRIKILILLHKN